MQITLSYIQEQEEACSKSYEHSVDAWWETLPIEDRKRAFYAVVKRIHDNELVKQASYRYILYDVFGFDSSMYAVGMDCGFMSLHNAIKTEEEEQILLEYRLNKGESVT